MTPLVSRRRFIVGVSALAGAGVAATAHRLSAATEPAPASATPGPYAGFPRVELATVEKFVGLAHRDLAEVQRMVEAQPALARASWDWGFGDWETALGAASHMGNKEIARFLLAKGAPPTIFSAAMLGQLDVVKAIVAANPGVEQFKGPHGIPLIAHAKAGGEPAVAVVAFLEPLERPENQIALKPLSDEEVKMLCGNYSFGKGPRDRFEITFADDRLGVARVGGTRRFLFHRGDFEFYPSGAESVRVRFTVQGGKATALTVFDPDAVLKAVRG